MKEKDIVDFSKMEETEDGFVIDEDGNEQESAPHPKQVLYVALSADASVYDILRRAEKETE